MLECPHREEFLFCSVRSRGKQTSKQVISREWKNGQRTSCPVKLDCTQGTGESRLSEGLSMPERKQKKKKKQSISRVRTGSNELRVLFFSSNAASKSLAKGGRKKPQLVEEILQGEGPRSNVLLEGGRNEGRKEGRQNEGRHGMLHWEGANRRGCLLCTTTVQPWNNTCHVNNYLLYLVCFFVILSCPLDVTWPIPR